MLALRSCLIKIQSAKTAPTALALDFGKFPEDCLQELQRENPATYSIAGSSMFHWGG
jgi:hypothetical protein